MFPPNSFSAATLLCIVFQPVAVQSAFKRSKTVEDIQREMSLRCENGAKLLMRRHHALRRVTPRGLKSQYSSSNVEDFWASVSENGAKLLTRRRAGRLQNPILPFQTLMDRIESENQNGTEVLTRRRHCHIVHFAASRRTASKRNINIQNVGVQDQLVRLGANVVIDAALPCTSSRHAARLQNTTSSFKALLASIRLSGLFEERERR
ncbi:hypothetical protein C8F04DRAFT_1181742 [Mycena alexandri]|uniref:Uncharacterized protein n=1 Tax=Mycena alexandri TaxID=1745969 RepID=A0AAD6X437_9AGAR|nr:hypothetical protein C8F04DRAFT_1181742 [Mycena alexandri]